MADMLYQPSINQDIAYDYHVFPQLIEGAPGAEGVQSMPAQNAPL